MFLAHPTNGDKCATSEDTQHSTQKLILSPQGRQQNLSLGTNPIDDAEPCYPHDNIVGSHLCDECMKSTELNVGHKLLSIW